MSELPTPCLRPLAKRSAVGAWSRGTVADVSADSLSHAYEALATGEVEPLVTLIHPEMEWRGRRRLSRFWKPPPS
jgi:hypothetical protein